MIYVFWSAQNIKEAKAVILELLGNKLIACASVIPKVLSFYKWEGELNEDEEVKVILKTKEAFFEGITETIKEMGSYDVPEVSMVDTQKANPDYLLWLDENLK